MGGGRVGSHHEINNIQIEKKYVKKIPAWMMRTLPLPPFIYFTKKPNFSTQTLWRTAVCDICRAITGLYFFRTLSSKMGDKILVVPVCMLLTPEQRVGYCSACGEDGPAKTSQFRQYTHNSAAM